MQKTAFYIVFFAIWAVNCSILSAQTYDDYLNQSFDYLETDSLQAAEQALKAALKLEPGNPANGAVLLNLGTIQRRQGKLEEAAESYTVGLGFMPDNALLLKSRAQLYAELEDYSKAIADYSMLILQQPDDEELLYDRALCRLMTQDTLGARLDLETIDHINPMSAKSRLGMALVYKAKGQWREAAELYDVLIERNPRSASLLRDRAEVHYLSNRFGAALDDINKSIGISPRDPLSYILRAQIRYARGDKEYARRDLNQALDLGLKEEEAGDLVQKLK